MPITTSTSAKFQVTIAKPNIRCKKALFPALTNPRSAYFTDTQRGRELLTLPTPNRAKPQGPEAAPQTVRSANGTPAETLEIPVPRVRKASSGALFCSAKPRRLAIRAEEHVDFGIDFPDRGMQVHGFCPEAKLITGTGNWGLLLRHGTPADTS